MPKIKIEFDLSNPDDVIDHKIYLDAKDNYVKLWELKHNFWRKFKYEPTSGQKVLDELEKELEDFISHE
jgi:hypothetical protein